MTGWNNKTMSVRHSFVGDSFCTLRYLGRVSHVISEHQFIITIIQFQIQCSTQLNRQSIDEFNSE